MNPFVLVVCNEKDPAIIMRRALLSAGLSVQIAHHAPGALDRIAAYKPDLIILDMMLPRIGGIALLQTLRKNPTTREIPVILTTASTSSADHWAASLSSRVHNLLVAELSPRKIDAITNQLRVGTLLS